MRFPPKDLALLWRIPFPSGANDVSTDFALRERIKELNCLYGMSKLAERHTDSLDDFLQELVDFLPYSWQYPENACARILFDGKSYASSNFYVTNWRQSSRIYMYHEAMGECTIYYLKELPAADEGPFLKEERALLDAIAEQIGSVATRIKADSELQGTNLQLNLERKALQESNTALKTVLTKIENEKQEIYKDISNNIEKILIPILNSLAGQLPPFQKKYIELIKTNLENIGSPFVKQLSSSCYSMSPTETTICGMIRNGMRTKEIARLRGVSEATINHHREKIRRKLNVTNKKINLATFLQSNMWEEKPISSTLTQLKNPAIL